MRKLPTIFIAAIGLLVGRLASAGESIRLTTNAPARIELNDQFDAPQKLSFPNTNVTLLTIADKKGSEQIAGWVEPLKQHYGNRIDIRGIADVSSVPGALRGFVRKRFQKLQSYPIMLDWSGDTVKEFTCVPNKANILVLDGRGRIVQRISGAANAQAIKDMIGLIDWALATQGSPPATK
jgi:hypothetical protein